MQYDFDHVPDRHGTHSIKWDAFPADVLPLWVADTDFAVAPCIIEAIQKRLQHPIFGYTSDNEQLKTAVVNRMKKLYNWSITGEDIILVPGIVSGFNFACRAFAKPGESVIFQTPVYPPFFGAPNNNHLETIENPLIYDNEKRKYLINFDHFDQAIKENTKLFILCNPHNPVGRVFTKEELYTLGNICLKHHVTVCSDEIHSDFIYKGFHHTPIASINDDFAQNTLTFIAPSKTFNIAGLSCSIAIAQNPEIRKKFHTAIDGLCPFVTCLSQEAACAAYTSGNDWLAQQIAYLESNRDFLDQFIKDEMPSVSNNIIEGTYLAWLDCSKTNITGSPQKYFLEKAKVGLNDGKPFGESYEKFIRLNFGTNRSTLKEALERMASSLKTL